MPRRPRFVCEGEPHHVTQRGNYQQYIIESDEDFRKYSYLVAEYAPKYGITILAYCLMNNHVHFIVVPKTKSGFSRFFNVVHMLYSQYKNLSRCKKGHLWQSRFFSSVLDSNYLIEAVRYVEQNPVRAKMVKRPWDYVWSSASAHVFKNKKDIIEIEPGDNILKISGKRTWEEYLTVRNEQEDEIIRSKTIKGYILGSENYIASLEQKSGRSLKEKLPGRPRK